MKIEVIYDGACPFCDDYVRYQRLRAAAETVELVDARAHPEVLRSHGLVPADLEDGMVVVIDGRAHHGAAAVHQLSVLSEPPPRWWVRLVAAVSRSPRAARILYPFLKRGRRIALAMLGVPRFPRQ
jgi:predicted DCC family thiol-disulfide oxidoreductase YuxK